MSPFESDRISALRSQRGMSKARLAREAGVSDAYIVQIEKGQKVPSLDVLRRISAALGLHPLHLPVEFGLVHGFVSDFTKTMLSNYASAVAEGNPEHIRQAGLSVSRALESDGLDEEGHVPDWVLELEGVLSVAPPEGWTRLLPEHRKIVQQLITLILAGADYE